MGQDVVGIVQGMIEQDVLEGIEDVLASIDEELCLNVERSVPDRTLNTEGG